MALDERPALDEGAYIVVEVITCLEVGTHSGLDFGTAKVGFGGSDGGEEVEHKHLNTCFKIPMSFC